MRKSFLVSLMLWPSFACQAEDYYVNPVFSVSERYNTNINMFEKPLQDNWITTISPGLNFGLRSETETLDSNFTWNHLAYTNQSELDFDEQLLNANYENKLTDRLTLGLTGYYNNRAALNTFRNETTNNPEDPAILGDPNLSNQGVESINIGPSATYLLDELNSINLGYSYSQTTFDTSSQKTAANVFRSDYNYHQLSGSLSHIYSERDTIDLTLSTSRYESKFTGQSQTTYNSIAQVGWQHSFNEQWTASVSGGLNYAVTDTTVQNPAVCTPLFPPAKFPCLNIPASEDTFKNNGIGKIFSISIQKSFERGSISLGAAQNQSPTSQGLQTQTSIFLNSAYTISERLTSGLSANYSTSESASGVNNQSFNTNRSNYSISPNISWNWTPEINTGLSYTYRQQEFDGGQPAQGNILQLQFSYSPQLNDLVK
jgi:hypothetical protein